MGNIPGIIYQEPHRGSHQEPHRGSHQEHHGNHTGITPGTTPGIISGILNFIIQVRVIPGISVWGGGGSSNTNICMVGVTCNFVGLFEEKANKNMGGWGGGGGEKKYAPPIYQEPNGNHTGDHTGNHIRYYILAIRSI